MRQSNEALRPRLLVARKSEGVGLFVRLSPDLLSALRATAIDALGDSPTASQSSWQLDPREPETVFLPLEIVLEGDGYSPIYASFNGGLLPSDDQFSGM